MITREEELVCSMHRQKEYIAIKRSNILQTDQLNRSFCDSDEIGIVWMQYSKVRCGAHPPKPGKSAAPTYLIQCERKASILN